MIGWRYLHRGRVAHAINEEGRSRWASAWCGVSPPWPGDWYGTGSQREYERVAALPRCQRCEARGAK